MRRIKLLPSVRPYWHVDAKWICGILFVLLMGACLLANSLVQLTSQKNGPVVAALAIGAVFVRGDVDDLKSDAREAIAKNGGVLHPIPNMPEVVITKQDLKLSLAELKLKVFKPLANSIYDNGLEGAAAKFTKKPKERRQFVKDATILQVFTKDTHRSLQKAFIILLVLSMLFLAGVAYFSAGWGRAANPGFLLSLVALPGVALSLALGGNGGADGGLASTLLRGLGQRISHALGSGYFPALWIGLALLLVAAVGKGVTTIQHRRSKKTAAVDNTSK